MKRKNKLSAIDLFCGAGGFSVGAKKAGLKMRCAFDSDEKALGTYHLNFSEAATELTDLITQKAADVCERNDLKPGDVDVVLAGPPCRGFSISNLRTRNEENPLNHAWRSVVAYARYLRPQSVIIENVAGIETYNQGATVKQIHRSFARIGYRTKRYLLDAADFGVPQRRKRVFFVATADGGLPESILPRRQDTTTVGMALSDLPSLVNGNTVDALPYRLHGAALCRYQKSMRAGKSRRVKNCLSSSSTPLIQRRFASVPQGGNWSDIPRALFNTYRRPENCHRWLYRRLADDIPSVTISNFRKNMLIHPWENRTLSVREAARLQGIRDNFLFTGNLQSQQQQVANAVPPALAEAVCRAVLAAL